jgi:glycosyltransferase involved in cell wall biosynthesis
VLRLDLVSPLPPVRSGISDYTADLLPELAREADVRLLRVEDQPVSQELLERYRPEPAARVGDDGRLALYQVGNNPYHDRVVELARRVPGVITLHDVVLHHRLLESTVAKGDWRGYAEALTAEHGALGRAVVEAWRWGTFGRAAQFALAANRRLLAAQRGVLVHSRWARGVLEEEIPGLAVRTIPMAVPLPAAASAETRARARERWGLPRDVPVLGSFGFQSPVKRTEVAVRALALPGLESARLLVAGQLAESYDLLGLARRLGVADRLTLLGYVPFEDLEEAIAACDLCVNLRYPSAGETSASLLRVLALGRPALVSDYAQFRDLPQDVAPRVPLGDSEVAVLASLAAGLLASPERLRELSTAARDYVRREHDPTRAARAIVEACEEMLEAPSATPWTPSVESELTSWTATSLPGEISIEGLADWRGGERRSLRIRLTNRGPARWLNAASPGGLALELHLRDATGRDALARQPWLPLPRDLGAGQPHVFEIQVRRPLGAARLRIEPRVLGRERLAVLGGPAWEGEV